MDIITGTLSAAVSVQAAYFCLAAIGLNVQFGYAGLLNFGQAGFLAVGAYGFAVAVASFELPFFAAVAVGLGCTALLALLLGIPTLRLRADYLAIATIAAAEVIRLFFGATFREYFKGRDGVSGFTADFQSVNPFDSSVLGFRPGEFWVMVVGWTLVVLSSVFVWLLMRSPWGRIMKGIREDEDAVRSLGKNVYSYKMQALVLGGLIGALGGLVLALGQNSVQPDNFNADLTFIVYTMLILGGAARIFGPIFGAIVFWAALSFIGAVLTKLTRGDDPFIPSWLMTDNQVGSVRFMVVGLCLMALMIFRPQGVFGDRKEIALDAR